MLYVNNNETILPAEEFSIHSGSRAFLYGDGVFESIRIRNVIPINLENHIKRMLEGYFESSFGKLSAFFKNDESLNTKQYQ